MKSNHTLTKVARLLVGQRGTILREFEFRHGGRDCRAEQGCNKVYERSQGSSNARRIKPWVSSDVALCQEVEWSPAQIADKLAVRHDGVNQYFNTDKARGGKLHKCLRTQKPRRKCRLCGRDRSGHILNRCPISVRHLQIVGHKQIGHWVGNTVFSAGHSQEVVTIVECKCGFAKFNKVANKTAELLSHTIEDVLKPFNALVKTLKVDKSKEYAYYQEVDQALCLQNCFADSYCSWLGRSYENFNGLLREFIQNKRRMETVTDEELAMIENRLNHLYRKRLRFKTHHEVFYASLNRAVSPP